MRRICALIACCLAAFAVAPAHARTVTVIEWEEWVEEAPAHGSDRFVSGVPLEHVAGIATYGPFRVIDPTRAALVGITDQRSPAQFAAMLRDYPGLAMLEMVECPGTFDDLANLRLGRMIRGAGIATHVPGNGSVRSGAVELFLAGSLRTVEDGASFAVHAWEDDSGLEATDYAATAPENRKYLDYYREMGMSAQRAQAFYAMTNSVPFADARWLTAEEMRGWIATEEPAAPQLAYLDLNAPLN